MENANEAAAPLSLPPADSPPIEEGDRTPRHSEGGDAFSPITDSTSSSLPVIRADEDEIISPSSRRPVANINVHAISAATDPLASSDVGEHEQAAPAQDSSGHHEPGAVGLDGQEAGGSGGEHGLRDLNSATRGSIPNIPVVFATAQGQGARREKPFQRGRFGRAHRAVNEETKAEARREFWAGVKPARVNSMLVQPAGDGKPGLSLGALRAAMKFKKKANVIQAKSALSKYILTPRSLRMQYWKNWMLVNIMFTVLVTPLRISFQVPAEAFGLVLAGIVNISFIADTVLHFFTAVETESTLVTDRKEIARRYLKSWFFLDLLTCIPFTTLLRHVIPPSLMILAPLRGLRLLKLLKVVKVYTVHYEVSPVAMSIGKTLVTVILAAHLLSCFWFWVHCYDALQEGTPKEWDQCGRPSSVASQYLSSFYFIIYTMMTALILSVCIQLTGATLFGFIIAATRRIVQFIAPIQKVTTTNLQKISEYALDRRLPASVSSRIKRHFRYFYFKTSVFDEKAVMQHVPWQLCEEVMSTTHGVAISATGLLQDHGFSPVALMRLARAMKPMELESLEEAILQGDTVLQVYFVVNGRIEAYVHEDHASGRASWTGGDLDGPPLRNASYLGVWGPGSLWGLSNIMLGGCSEATFVAASPSDLLWLDQADLIAAMGEHSEMRACLEKTAGTDRNSLRDSLGSATITKEGLKLKQISLTDFKASDLKQQLKHTDIRSLCTAASANQLAAASAGQSGVGSAGGVAGIVQDFQQMAFRGRGVRGRLKSIVGSVKGALGGGQRSQMRLVRTWRGGSHGFGDVVDGTGRVVTGVTETEETPEELNHRLIMLPDQPIKLRWDVAISMVCVLVAVLTPYRMAFAHIDASSWLVFDAVVDLLFVLDILLRFRTAYLGNAANNVIVYITLPGMIAKNYLRGWMVFDLASTVPGYLFGAPDKVFRGLVVLKLLRIGRVPALAQQLHRLREQKAMSNSGIRRRSLLALPGIHIEVPRWCLDVVQILVVILYASHIFGCVWWVTSRYDDDESWWERDGLDIDDATSTYIASLYWAATTITTVGYGDLVPTNDLERMVACLTMVCGTTMFSYVIGSVSTLVMNPTGGHVRRKMEMMNVENYLEEQGVGVHLGDAVRTHMVFVTGARSAWNEDHILSRLPPRLQERVLEHVHRDAVLIIPILKTKPPSFVAAILRNLRPRQFSQGEVVYKNLQMSQGVYFVTKGIAEAYAKVSNGSGCVEEKVKGIVSAGKLFGYSRFLAAFLEEDMAVKAFTPLYVYLLSNSSIRHLLQYHPFLAEDLRMGLEEAVFQQASEEISSDKKRQAAKRTFKSSRSEAYLNGTSSKPPEHPNGQPCGRAQRERRTTAPTSYLRRDSSSVVPTSVDYYHHLHERERRAGEEARIAPPSAGSGRKRRASGTVREGEEEEKRTGKNAARWAGHLDREDDKRQPQVAFSPRIDTADSSEEESTSLPPGLSGVLVTQLTWGADEWNAAKNEAEASAAGGGTATAETDSHSEQRGLVGSSKPLPVAILGDLDNVSDGTAGGPGVGAERRGETEAAEADALEGRRDEGAGGDGASGSRRMTFTERLEPLRHSPGIVGVMLSTWNAENVNHLGPSQRGGTKGFKGLGDAGQGLSENPPPPSGKGMLQQQQQRKLKPLGSYSENAAPSAAKGHAKGKAGGLGLGLLPTSSSKPQQKQRRALGDISNAGKLPAGGGGNIPANAKLSSKQPTPGLSFAVHSDAGKAGAGGTTKVRGSGSGSRVAVAGAVKGRSAAKPEEHVDDVEMVLGRTGDEEEVLVERKAEQRAAAAAAAALKHATRSRSSRSRSRSQSTSSAFAKSSASAHNSGTTSKTRFGRDITNTAAAATAGAGTTGACGVTACGVGALDKSLDSAIERICLNDFEDGKKDLANGNKADSARALLEDDDDMGTDMEMGSLAMPLEGHDLDSIPDALVDDEGFLMQETELCLSFV
eukprot:g12253.t1